MENQEYPKMLYQKGDVTKQKIVNNEDEEIEAGTDWWDSIDDGTGADDE